MHGVEMVIFPFIYFTIFVFIFNTILGLLIVMGLFIFINSKLVVLLPYNQFTNRNKKITQLDTANICKCVALY